jgi:hypothetical protein
MTNSQKKTARFIERLLNQHLEQPVSLFDTTRSYAMGDVVFEVRAGGERIDSVRITPLGRPSFIDETRIAEGA